MYLDLRFVARLNSFIKYVGLNMVAAECSGVQYFGILQNILCFKVGSRGGSCPKMPMSDLMHELKSWYHEH